MHNEPQFAQRALRAGATGYLCKVRSPETLLCAIRRVAAGKRYIDPQITEGIAFEAIGLRPQYHHNKLTSREFQVLRLLASGNRVTAIAEKLTISSKTVSTHKARLMDKMGLSNNAAIVRYAVSQNLIE